MIIPNFHRIIEQFGLEGTFQVHLVQAPWDEQGCLQLDQVIKSSIQSDLECLHFQHPFCNKVGRLWSGAEGFSANFSVAYVKI